MPLSTDIENKIAKTIEDATPENFEVICNKLLKRIPNYNSLLSCREDPYRSAGQKKPDAYIVSDDNKKIIYFEYTTTANDKDIKRYVKDVLQRKYYQEKEVKGRLTELVLVFSQNISSGMVIDFKEKVKEHFNCSCTVFVNDSLKNLFTQEAADLIQPLLDIDIHPKWFSSLENALNHNRNITFPPLGDFENENIYINDSLIDEIASIFCENKGPCLLTGRWGSGKTVFAIALGFRLQRNNDFTVYYLDLKEHMGRDQRNLYKIRDKVFIPFSHSKVLFIIDNCHVFPHETYKFAQDAKKINANVLFISRPVSSEVSGEFHYFPFLFNSHINESDDYDNENDNLLPDKDLVKKDDFQTTYNNHFTLSAIKEVVRWMVKNYLSKISSDYKFTDNDLSSLCDNGGWNLNLIALHLREWRFGSKPIYEIKIKNTSGFLIKRFHLDRFPEIYLLATLNYFDCPADINILFPDPDRKSKFISTFFSDSGDSTGIIMRRSNKVFGINSGEARLICEVWLSREDPIPTVGIDNKPRTVNELFKLLINHYVSDKPPNIYRLIRCLWWSAFESFESNDPKTGEELQEILVSLLTCPEFTDYLNSEVIPQDLSIYEIGSLARLHKHLGLNINCPNFISPGSIKKAIQKKHHSFIFKEKDFRFTWREFFAWKHLAKLNHTLGHVFLEEFGYDKLRKYGEESLLGLSHVFHISSKDKWLQEKLDTDLLIFFEDSSKFDKDFSKINNAIKIAFFIRNCKSFGQLAVDRLSLTINPKRMAEIVKDLRAYDVRLFSSISKNLGKQYYDEFSNYFDDTQIYDLAYKCELKAINPFSDILYKRFLREDLKTKLKTSDFHEIQLFLRNLSLHGFSIQQRIGTANFFQDKDIMEIMINKINKETPHLLDIAFFILNIGILSDKTANDYARKIIKIDLNCTIDKAKLHEISLFLIGFWTAGSFLISEIIDPEKLGKLIEAKLEHSTVLDIITTGGIINLFNLGYKIPNPFFEKVFNRVGPCLSKYQSHILKDRRKKSNYYVNAFRLTLLFEGINYFDCSTLDKMLSHYLDKKALSYLLIKEKDDFEIDYGISENNIEKTSSVAVKRKYELINKAIKSLGTVNGD